MNNIKTWEELSSKIRAIVFNESFDLIVAIADGGIIPAALINQRLGLPIHLLKISYRDAKQQPLYDSPKLVDDISADIKKKKILLVEDRVKTGATLRYAKELLSKAASVKTFAVNGNADYALYNEACFNFPWII
jgi:xanthine phosphoribosyltransferase